MVSLPEQVEALAAWDHKLAIASSNLTGNIWNGFIRLATLDNDAIQLQKYKGFECCVSKCIWQDRLICGLDNGTLVAMNEELKELEKIEFLDGDVVVLDGNERFILAADHHRAAVRNKDLRLFRCIELKNGYISSGGLIDDEMFLINNERGESWMYDARQDLPVKMLAHADSAIMGFSYENSLLTLAAESGMIVQLDTRNDSESVTYTVIYTQQTNRLLQSMISVSPTSYFLGSQDGYLISLSGEGNNLTVLKEDSIHIDSITCMKIISNKLITGSIDNTVKLTPLD